MREFVGCHAVILRSGAKKATPFVALQRKCAPAQIRHNDAMSQSDEIEKEQRRQALVRFHQRHLAQLGKLNNWAIHAEVGYNTLNEYYHKKKDKKVEYETFAKLAKGASKLIGRRVTVAEIVGEETGEVLSADELAFITLYRRLPGEDKDWIWSQIRREAERAGIAVGDVPRPLEQSDRPPPGEAS